MAIYEVIVEKLVHNHGILHNIVSDQGTQFKTIEVCQWVRGHGICFFYNPKAAGMKWSFINNIIVAWNSRTRFHRKL